jgi:uncharacterized protein (DUF4415 family)
VFHVERFVVTELYVQEYIYMQMKAKAGVSKGKKTARRKTISLQAAADDPGVPDQATEHILRWYKPRKKVVTLRLDADVLAWFKKDGDGYQTRINKALRGVMWVEQRRGGG